MKKSERDILLDKAKEFFKTHIADNHVKKILVNS